jgi:acylphosphatase
MIETRHYLISGKVQRVSYRLHTQKKAQSLNLTGWVKNLKDGRVETVASGSAEGLAEFKKYLWQGPVLAKVSDIQIEIYENDKFKDFLIL